MGIKEMKTYIGDGIYAQIDNIGRLILTTENGISVTNTIVFEPQEWLTLINWIRRESEKNP